MKKVIGLLAVVLISTAAMAQGGGGPQMTPEERIAMMKQRLEPVGLSPVHTDSVIAIMMDRSIMAGANLRDMSPEERQAKMKEWSEARAKRMAKAGIPEEQIKKVMELMTARPGGGRGGGR